MLPCLYAWKGMMSAMWDDSDICMDKRFSSACLQQASRRVCVVWLLDLLVRQVIVSL